MADRTGVAAADEAQAQFGMDFLASFRSSGQISFHPGSGRRRYWRGTRNWPKRPAAAYSRNSVDCGITIREENSDTPGRGPGARFRPGELRIVLRRGKDGRVARQRVPIPDFRDAAANRRCPRAYQGLASPPGRRSGDANTDSMLCKLSTVWAQYLAREIHVGRLHQKCSTIPRS